MVMWCFSAHFLRFLTKNEEKKRKKLFNLDCFINCAMPNSALIVLYFQMTQFSLKSNPQQSPAEPGKCNILSFLFPS